MGKIEVSIVCNTYNHGSYIKDAIESFLAQETNFEYEILIHDDASTDNTAEVIRKFENKFPNIIKPIYQVENQYSRGINVTSEYAIPRLKGKYIALCEGDDYWTDPMKLQKQYDEMEMHPEVDMCAHAATKVRASDKKVVNFVMPDNKKCILSIERVIAGGGGFVATNSLFYRRELAENEPDFRKRCPYDFALQIQGALRGGILYLPDNMSAYRIGVPGSWTKRMATLEYNKLQTNEIITMLDMVDQETEGRYAEIIRKSKSEVEFDSLELAGKYKELRKGKYRSIYEARNWKWKVKMYLREMYIYLNF